MWNSIATYIWTIDLFHSEQCDTCTVDHLQYDPYSARYKNEYTRVLHECDISASSNAAEWIHVEGDFSSARFCLVYILSN